MAARVRAANTAKSGDHDLSPSASTDVEGDAGLGETEKRVAAVDGEGKIGGVPEAVSSEKLTRVDGALGDAADQMVSQGLGGMMEEVQTAEGVGLAHQQLGQAELAGRTHERGGVARMAIGDEQQASVGSRGLAPEDIVRETGQQQQSGTLISQAETAPFTLGRPL